MTAVQTLTKQNLQSVLSFDGKDDYVTIPHSKSLDLTNNYTIEAWINPDALGGRLVDKGIGGKNEGFTFDTYGGLRFINKGIHCTSNSLKTQVWQHVAVVFENKLNGVKLFVNGNEVAVQTPSRIGSSQAQLPIRLGSQADSVASLFYGKMAEVRIWNKARSQEEINENMDCRLSGKEEGLTAYFPLNGDASDASANNNNGTIHGATWTQENLDFLQPAIPQVEIAEIVYHGHVKRSQSDEYIEICNSGNTAADLSNWKVTSTGKNQIFAFPEGTSLAAGAMIRVYTNEVHQESGGFSFGSKTAIWNDKGDMGKLLDAEGKEVSSFSYDNN